MLACLLSFSRKLMQARQAGLIYGTDASLSHFLPPGRWDRGVMDRFSGRGIRGLVFRFAGKHWVRMKGNSPVHLYRTDEMGNRVEKEGITAYTLRNHQGFYDRGIKILLTDNQDQGGGSFEKYRQVPVVTYDGISFNTRRDLMLDTSIVSQFNSDNFISAYIPDYGAVVFNTVSGKSIVDGAGAFIYDDALKARLDILISVIEKASLAHLGRVKGRAAAKMIWRKETGLRKSTARVKEKERLLDEQERQLLTVGAVTPDQLNMSAVSVHDGVYAFIDMVGSTGISKRLTPRDYVDLLNSCHEIAAENAGRFGCRMGNIIGDGVVFQNVFVFDKWEGYHPTPQERLMLMTLMLSSVINDIHQLARGHHYSDRGKQVYHLVKSHRLQLCFRAGMSQGRAIVGPLGSQKRKIVTAIGETVDLASRLESCGAPNHIHTTRNVAAQLLEARISRDTTWIYETVKKLDGIRQWNHKSGFPFLDFYKTAFNLNQDPICKKEESRYKEFSASDTRLIRCLPETGFTTCPGI